MQWDRRKARENERKHGIRFSDVEPVLYDPYAITIEDSSSMEERRFVTLGRDGLGRTLVMVYTHRADDIRVISARKATRSEVRTYEKGV
jgi:uncharacterized protein